MDRELINITTTCGDTTLHYLKTSNTTCAPGTNMGLMVGRGSNIDIASVCVVAGYVDDITTLTWPGNEGDLVQTVTSSAVQEEEEPPIITDEVTEEPPVVTEKPTEEVTKAPTAEVTKPATTDGSGSTEKKGCGSTVAAGAIAMVLALAPIALNKRKED